MIETVIFHRVKDTKLQIRRVDDYLKVYDTNSLSIIEHDYDIIIYR